MADIFVFGSNLAGRHGAGSALEAIQKHGAVYGQGIGRQGNSFAIPTKDGHLKSLTMPVIRHFVEYFLQYAKEHPEDAFNVVAIGCGLAGYEPCHIAPMFKGATLNVYLPEEFLPYMG